jgi:nitronate monooxygenase
MRITEILGIELPVIQAPMAGVQGSALAIAVSNAGGLGSLPCALLSVQDMQRELSVMREQTTRPYNVNFFCHKDPTPDEGREAQWRAMLEPYYRELGIDASAPRTAPARRPFSAEAAELLSYFKPPVVSFHFGLPAPELLQRVRSWGAKVLSSATTVAEARWLEANGVDVIIAQGYEAGGHRGTFLDGSVAEQMGTFALLPQIVSAVRLPVVAAGGIVDASTVSSAFSLGAAGAQAGTAYLLCPETATSGVHRAALKEERASRTQLTNLFSGGVARGIPNRLMRELGPINPAAPAFPLASGALAPLRAAAERAGSGDFSPLWAGQNTTRCTELPAARVTRDLAGS